MNQYKTKDDIHEKKKKEEIPQIKGIEVSF